jgi:hypothetical protein
MESLDPSELEADPCLFDGIQCVYSLMVSKKARPSRLPATHVAATFHRRKGSL